LAPINTLTLPRSRDASSIDLKDLMAKCLIMLIFGSP
jgi:hypothetical protein